MAVRVYGHPAFIDYFRVVRAIFTCRPTCGSGRGGVMRVHTAPSGAERIRRDSKAGIISVHSAAHRGSDDGTDRSRKSRAPRIRRLGTHRHALTIHARVHLSRSSNPGTDLVSGIYQFQFFFLAHER